jgi:hypothetical protein
MPASPFMNFGWPVLAMTPSMLHLSPLQKSFT